MSVEFKKYIKIAGLVWAGCAVLFVLAYVTLLRPQGQLKKKISAELARSRKTYDSTLDASRAHTKKQLRAKIEQLRQNLRQFVTDAEGSANLTFDISQLAKQIDLASFSIKTTDSRTTIDIPDCTCIRQKRIDVSFFGTFNQFATFVNELERHSPIVFIDNFSIKRSTHNELGHEVNISLLVFVEKGERKYVRAISVPAPQTVSL